MKNNNKRIIKDKQSGGIISGLDFVQTLCNQPDLLDVNNNNIINQLTQNNLFDWKNNILKDYLAEELFYTKTDNNSDLNNIMNNYNNLLFHVFELIQNNENLYEDIKYCYIAGIICCITPPYISISWNNFNLNLKYDKNNMVLINVIYYFIFYFFNNSQNIEFIKNEDLVFKNLSLSNKTIAYQRLNELIDFLKIDLKNLNLL